MLSSALLSLAAASLVSANKLQHAARQAASSAPSAPVASSTPPSASTQATLTFQLASTNPTAVPLSSIVASQASSPTIPLPSTYPAGSTPTVVSNAPALPNAALLNPKSYPSLDVKPPTDSPEVQQWKQEVANSGIQIPNIPPTVAGGCPANPDAVKDTSRCWWTCGGCTQPSDISDCPAKSHWGLTYDDGPSFYTPNLMTYLGEQNLKATFFVVGSRCISFPAILQAEYMAGHQIGVHTWSHPALTTLTNDEIIAELGWTRKVIKDILGVTPNTMRPPYGDIDNRVRAISRAMGLTPVMWTRQDALHTFDTDDFNVHNGMTSAPQVLNNWNAILGNASQLDHGFIVLEHDLFEETVELATGYILPDALKRGITMEPVVTCLNKPLNDAYVELNDNKTNPPPVSASNVATLSSGAPGSAQATGAAGRNGAVQNAASGGSVAMLACAATFVLTLSWL
ncbi:chitin deacetylase [Moniliophthora roreri MCA 2997]|uniref:chitin deacetylase n=1 Tax=Moniliophthora roreri (strain MCA 2997) TaxID=1381753 RepID=V2XWU5_MONRO|nr:chitin deacetylase [Moniliophthora roreri MCA 2997]KAI3622158.1 chitin deacetylase [Moniliophthora roreri]